MGEGARVGSVDAIRSFRAALFKFAESTTLALGDAESELNRTLNWLETEQQSYWNHQIRKRQEVLGRAKEALRQKQLFKDASGRTPSAVEEEKMVRLATRRLEEATVRLNNTRQWARRMHKELQSYKGSVQRFASVVGADVPAAAGQLDQLVAAVEKYIELAPPSVDFSQLQPSDVVSMARPEGEEPSDEATKRRSDEGGGEAQRHEGTEARRGPSPPGTGERG